MGNPSTQQSPTASHGVDPAIYTTMPLEDIDGNGDNESHFVFNSIASQSFGDYLADTDTDTDNSSLQSTHRWVWYCKLRTCPKYYTAWSCKSNFLLHLYETPLHSEDASTRTREGRRQLARSWREETAYDLSEPKKRPPEEGDDEGKEKNVVT